MENAKDDHNTSQMYRQQGFTYSSNHLKPNNLYHKKTLLWAFIRTGRALRFLSTTWTQDWLRLFLGIALHIIAVYNFTRNKRAHI